METALEAECYDRNTNLVTFFRYSISVDTIMSMLLGVMVFAAVHVAHPKRFKSHALISSKLNHLWLAIY